MKVEGIVFSIYAVFLGAAGTVYWILIRHSDRTETAGVVALLISMGLGALIGGYLLFTARRMEPRPQDLPDAEVADGAGELGNFSPRSYWPFFIAFALFLAMLGLIVGVWLGLLAGVIVLYAVVGLVFEQYRNRFSPEDS
jgi:cytochrome c oxidase subunit IV